jgi:hypothetical protein
MSVHSLFSNGVDPLAGIVWTAREVTLQGAERKVITVMAPDHWSMTAVAVFASHYLRVVNGVRETHFGEAINRLAETVSGWALADGYVDAESAAVLRNELAYMLVYQMWSPNSPVWYNVGTVARPQISACYIQHLSDAMDGDDGIIALQSAETRLFRRGSGTGTNHSNLRPEGYPISVGGTASGPVSFMRGFDATAGAIKSGGSTRRAAKMVILNDDHPDIEKYVDSKVDVEQMAWDLVDAGHSSDYNGKMYANLALQNANHSVGVSDAFMDAVATDGLWTLQWGGVPARTIRARELWDRIVRAAHYCGDPGLQFRDTINHWHTSPSGGAIHGSNPCAEFVYIDDSACNLAAHNLRQYQRHAAHPYARRAWNSDPSMVNTIDVQALGHGVEISILVQDVLVSRASYPTPAIEINSLKYRPLGMGYANLGALLMSLGLGYDTDAGRAYAGAITSFIGAEAYRVSQQLARTKGVSFAQNAADGANMRRVLSQHAQAAQRLAEQASFVASQKDAPPALTGYTGMVATDAAALATQAHGVWVKVMNADVLPLAEPGDHVRPGQGDLLVDRGEGRTDLRLGVARLLRLGVGHLVHHRPEHRVEPPAHQHSSAAVAPVAVVAGRRDADQAVMPDLELAPDVGRAHDAEPVARGARDLALHDPLRAGVAAQLHGEPADGEAALGLVGQLALVPVVRVVIERDLVRCLGQFLLAHLSFSTTESTTGGT